ncbi:MAG: response regulator [bacterium]|nr:response regulator [bacterium]
MADEISDSSPQAPLKERGQAYRLLAVDEDPAFLELLVVATQELGYEIHTMADFNTAAEYIQAEHPDVLLLGIETAQPQLLDIVDLIKRDPALRDTALMVLSGDETEKVKIKTLWRGADEYIQKPLNLAEFAIRLSNLCELRRYRRTLAEQNEKLQTDKKRLARYFSDDLVDRILENDPAVLAGANVRASLLFFDLRNSTGIGESLEPKQFSEFLTSVFTDIMDLIYGNQGSVNKMMGDGILATFGCPVSAGDDTLNCVRCALSIRDYLDTYNEVRPDYIRDPLRAGMGISTGKVFAGNVGSVRHIEYAVLGDPVNVASRLEQLTRRVPVDILIDGETRDWMGQRAAVRRVRANRLRGKTQATRIYALDRMVNDEPRIGPAHGPNPE